MRSHLLAATIAAALLAVPCLTAHAGGRVALVIGMSGYRHAPALKNPANDAKDMSTALRELGFAVTEAADLDKRSLDEAVRTFAHRIAGADAALVFFGGHGLQVAGQNYLLPIDAKLESERDLDFETVRLEFILRQMESGRDGKVSIVMIDACRDNPLARNLARSMGVRSEAFPRGLAPVQSGAGMFVAFSTQPGNVAYDGQGRNSPFAAALLRQYPHGRQGPQRAHDRRAQGRDGGDRRPPGAVGAFRADGGFSVPVAGWDHHRIDPLVRPADRGGRTPRGAHAPPRRGAGPPPGADWRPLNLIRAGVAHEPTVLADGKIAVACRRCSAMASAAFARSASWSAFNFCAA